MKEFDYRLLVNKHYLVSRHIDVENLNQTDLDNLLLNLIQQIGVDKVDIADSLKEIHIQYDASKRQLEDFETILNKYPCKLSSGWRKKIRRDWYCFMDENIYKNALQEPTHLNEINL